MNLSSNILQLITQYVQIAFYHSVLIFALPASKGGYEMCPPGQYLLNAELIDVWINIYRSISISISIYLYLDLFIYRALSISRSISRYLKFFAIKNLLFYFLLSSSSCLPHYSRVLQWQSGRGIFILNLIFIINWFKHIYI